jgi:succinylglutamate desuccinylase
MKVKIFGGTHGNEWTGVYVVTQYAEWFLKKFPELDIEFIFSNPKAYEERKRFCDEDLNRAFQYLTQSRTDSFEHQRAKEIKSLIEKEECFIIDLHTTTSNMGCTLIISQEERMNFQVAHFVQKRIQDCRVILSPDPEKKYLAGQSPYGLMIEVGPLANNVLDGVVLEKTLHLLGEILSSLTQLKSMDDFELEVFQEVQDVYYPLNEAKQLTAYVHPSLQGRDFQAVQGSFLSFKCFSGENLFFECKEKLYPIFINEAAYYPSHLAFTLCQKKKLSFNPLAKINLIG